MNSTKQLQIVNNHLKYPKVSLIEASSHYFIHIATEIDQSVLPFFMGESSKKKALLKFCKHEAKKLRKNNLVADCSVFKATVIPPGTGKYIQENKEKTQIAKFDIALLIEVFNLEALIELQSDFVYLNLISTIKKSATATHIITASNVRRIGAVNHQKQGVFLFNYFYGNSTEQNLGIWEYTAGWFEKETDLDNSTLLLPMDKNSSKYTIINHCRWNSLLDIIPDLLFKPSFKKYVLDNFYANQVGAQPILYKLA